MSVAPNKDFSTQKEVTLLIGSTENRIPKWAFELRVFKPLKIRLLIGCWSFLDLSEADRFLV